MFFHLAGTVQLVVACGPFTTNDNLLYEPLQDLLNAIARYLSYYI